jgi:hypothetical protein
MRIGPPVTGIDHGVSSCMLIRYRKEVELVGAPLYMTFESIASVIFTSLYYHLSFALRL